MSMDDYRAIARVVEKKSRSKVRAFLDGFSSRDEIFRQRDSYSVCAIYFEAAEAGMVLRD